MSVQPAVEAPRPATLRCRFYPLVLFAALGCSGTGPSSTEVNPVGGSEATGGSGTAHGATNTGGHLGSGGTQTTSLPSGGGAVAGGSASTGGVADTGGSQSLAGTRAIGGSAAAGGAPPVGGSSQSSTSLGGSTNTGGTSSNTGTRTSSGGVDTAAGGTASGGVDIAAGGTATGTVAATGGTRTNGGSSAAGSTMVGGTTAMGGTSGTGGSGGSTSAGVVCYGVPGASKSPLYTVTVGGVSAPVEKFTKFGTEMQVHYAHCSLSGTTPANVAVTLSQTFSSFTLSPKSRKIATTKSGNTVTFSSGPNYLILNVSGQELLFILLDAEETDPPHIGDANVKDISAYGVDNTGTSLVTQTIQTAINTASTATQNILYFPPGRYRVGELWLKSNVTLYLAGGAILYGSDNTGDFNTGSGGIDIEGAQHALIRMYQVKNVKILGRGALDANGHAMRAAGLKANLLKIEQSSNITVDGIVSRDPSYWNTLVYRSDSVAIQNYKVINCRPTSSGTVYNQTDGVDFDESTNGKLYNAFLYTGDDGMATKNEEPSGVINTKNITHEHVVVYNNSVGCKIGTKSMGQSMDGVTFKDVDIVKAGRALTIEAYDTALVQNTTFENIRVEAADSMLINLAVDQPPDWREAANTSSIKDTYFTNVTSDVKQLINLHGKSSAVNVNGVHFSNLTIQGKAITSQTDPDASWNINSYVSNITFE